jgi:hydroxymethylpyrimidine kinase/phosphomethylpyrimidine kinase
MRNPPPLLFKVSIRTIWIQIEIIGHAMHIPKVMTIAGSDSGGGAGIQADLKTIAALGGYGTSVITALTAQNTQSVARIHAVPPPMIRAQYRAIMDDIGTDAIKIGMLGPSPAIEAVAEALAAAPADYIVLDPVMISKSGAQLLPDDAIESLTGLLIPRCTVLTPNIPEAERLTGISIESDEDIRDAALRLEEMGAGASLIKGGHLDRPDIVNTLYDGSSFRQFTSPRLDSRFTHGTGCTLSSAIATYLGRGDTLADAVEKGIEFVTEGIRNGYVVGNGTNPLNHMYAAARNVANVRSN